MAKRSLGRGLDALLRDGTDTAQATTATQGNTVDVSKIKASPFQPRQVFDPEALAELTDSIKTRGVLQPLIVRKKGAGFELIAGERRLRASREAGLEEVPVTILDGSDSDALEVALIENLQRQDLNILEEAEGYQALAEKFSLTQDEIATRVGKARPSVANALRLLSLPVETKALLASGRISAGHAKVLTGLEIAAEQQLYADLADRDGLSVRALEKIIEKSRRAPRKSRAFRADVPHDHVAQISDQLHQHFGTRVRISPSRTYANGRKGKGSIEIDFHSNEELDRILELIGVRLD
jgi:ParB family chromosome partitioning protein